MKRPYILNHMEMTIDGKCNGKGMMNCQKGWELYVKKHVELAAEGYKVMAVGKNTATEFFTKDYKIDYTKYANTDIKYEDFVIKNEDNKYTVFFDRKASLQIENSIIKSELPGYGGSQVIEILTEKAPKDHIAYLKEKGISYIFAGKDELSIITALEKLKNLYNIEKILMEGGPTLNGAFIKENCIDELSLVVIPITGDDNDLPLFQGSITKNFVLKNTKIYQEDNFIWLNYERKN